MAEVFVTLLSHDTGNGRKNQVIPVRPAKLRLADAVNGTAADTVTFINTTNQDVTLEFAKHLLNDLDIPAFEHPHFRLNIPAGDIRTLAANLSTGSNANGHRYRFNFNLSAGKGNVGREPGSDDGQPFMSRAQPGDDPHIIIG